MTAKEIRAFMATHRVGSFNIRTYKTPFILAGVCVRGREFVGQVLIKASDEYYPTHMRRLPAMRNDDVLSIEPVSDETRALVERLMEGV